MRRYRDRSAVAEHRWPAPVSQHAGIGSQVAGRVGLRAVGRLHREPARALHGNVEVAAGLLSAPPLPSQPMLVSTAYARRQPVALHRLALERRQVGAKAGACVGEVVVVRRPGAQRFARRTSRCKPDDPCISLENGRVACINAC
jgi:hypothetical protein